MPEGNKQEFSEATSNQWPNEYKLACSVAVIKNLLLIGSDFSARGTLDRIEGANLLWELLNEFSNNGAGDLHYVEGMSKTVDRLLSRLKAEGRI